MIYILGAPQPVQVSNFPATQVISGNVAVTNFPSSFQISNLPATQPVSGTVAVSNLPATQPVSGTVAVSNFPATQPVSGNVGITNFPGTQPVSGTVAVSNLPGTQPVSGSVAVTNLPATQAVSAVSLPLPTGAALDSSLTTINGLITALNALVTSINGKVPSLGQATMAGSQPSTIASDQPPIPFDIQNFSRAMAQQFVAALKRSDLMRSNGNGNAATNSYGLSLPVYIDNVYNNLTVAVLTTLNNLASMPIRDVQITPQERQLFSSNIRSRIS